jgi:hypothetical protein
MAIIVIGGQSRDMGKNQHRVRANRRHARAPLDCNQGYAVQA